MDRFCTKKAFLWFLVFGLQAVVTTASYGQFGGGFQFSIGASGLPKPEVKTLSDGIDTSSTTIDTSFLEAGLTTQYETDHFNVGLFGAYRGMSEGRILEYFISESESDDETQTNYDNSSQSDSQLDSGLRYASASTLLYGPFVDLKVTDVLIKGWPSELIVGTHFLGGLSEVELQNSTNDESLGNIAFDVTGLRVSSGLYASSDQASAFLSLFIESLLHDNDGTSLEESSSSRDPMTIDVAKGEFTQSSFGLTLGFFIH